ncbi:hypothetical protein V8C26DRAFT_131638 [Trichoderma gracile]
MAEQVRGVYLQQVNSINETDGEPDVDIIAIHGLDTKSPDTWTWRSKDGEKPDVNWLSDPDMLPARLKRVRIFTCDWPADLLQDSSLVSWTIGEFARRLLAGIVDMRLPLAVDAKNRDRPILFIASCLGGIMLMKALVMADRPESDYYGIRKATRGIIFLATPFRGTSFQDIAAWVEPMMKSWASLRNRSVAQLLNSVKGSTYDLEQLVRAFTRLCQDADYPCKIHTFYETGETILQSKVLPVFLLPWLGQSKLLVDRSSATLDIDTDPLPLERRHVMMNKFCGPHDADYEVVAGRLDALLQMVWNGPLQQADAWIRDKHYTADRLRIQRLSGQRLPMDQCYINLTVVERFGERGEHPSTFSILSRQKVGNPGRGYHVDLATLFNEGRRRGSRLKRISIQGQAGVGKTTLCKKIVYEFQRQTWTEWNKLFDRVLWVPLRNLKLEERKRTGYNYECLFNDEYFSLPESKPELAQALAKALTTQNSKTLFLLDGLDEVSQLLVGEGTMACFLQDLLKQPNVIITSRPSAKPLSGMDLELEVTGFNDEQVEAYLNADPGIAPQVNEVKSFLRQHWLLQGLVRIPIQLDALCYTWDDFGSGTSPETMSAIYQAMEQKLWRKDAVRLGRMTEAEVESAHCIEIEDKVESEVKLLECLAFAGIYSAVYEYTSAHREKVSRAWRSSGKAYALGLPLDETLGRLSFLRSSDSSMMIKDRSYHFIHLTFQEYFAARYFVHHWSSRKSLRVMELGSQQRGNMKELGAESFLRKEKYNTRYDIFWRFVTGLLHARSDEDELCRFFRIIENQPRDLLGPVHQRLIMHCLSEVASPDGNGPFALTRKKLEHQLSQWLEFECEFDSDYNESPLFRWAAHLATEVEFPEKSLNDVLERASDNVQALALGGLGRRLRLPRSTIDLMTRWLESEDFDTRFRSSKWTVFRILSSHNDLPVQTLNALIRHIDHGDSITQGYVLKALRAQWTLPKEIRDILARRVLDGAPNFQRGALVALSGLPLEHAIDITVAQLDHPDAVVRQRTLGSLVEDSEFAGYVIQAVAARLEDRHEDIRKSALYVLQRQGTLPEDVIKLVIARLEDGAVFVRREALYVLRRQQTLPEDILKGLVAQLQVYDGETKAVALEALSNTSNISANVMKTVSTLVPGRDDILQSILDTNLLRRSSSLQEGLLRTAVHWITDGKTHVQPAAFRLLGASTELPGDVIASLSGFLRSHDEDIKLEILGIFSRQSVLPTEALEGVAAQLGHQSKDIARAALNVLGSRWNTQELPLDFKSTTMFLRDEDTKIRRNALEVLSKIPNLPNDILSAIVSQVKDPNQHMETRCAALSALRRHPHLSAEIVSEVSERLQDRDAAVREQAALALAAQSALPQGVVKALAVRLEDEAPLVRSAAAMALRNHSLSKDILDAIASLLADPAGWVVRAPALEALGSTPDLPPKIVKAVVRNLSDKDSRIRDQALQVLVNQDSLTPETYQVLAPWLEFEDGGMRLGVLQSLQRQPSLPDNVLHLVIAQLGDLPKFSGLETAVRRAALTVLNCQLALPDTILKKATSYRAWLTLSFREHVSCYVADGVIYFDVMDGLGKITLQGNSDEFMEAMLEVQKEVGVPRQIHDLYA